VIAHLRQKKRWEREKYLFSINAKHERRNTMPLIQLVIVLVVVGVILWVINSYIPMQSTIKRILNVVVVIVVIIWLLSVFGLIGNLSAIRVGR
jgi:Flp pilus assembly protein TadB